MSNSLGDLTHLDAIGIMADARHLLLANPRSTSREIAEATRVLKKAEQYQLSLTTNSYDYSSWYES